MATSAVQQAVKVLEQAVLQALKGTKGAAGIGPAAVSTNLGLYRQRGAAGLNDALAHGLLNSLEAQGMVERYPQANGRGGWRLT